MSDSRTYVDIGSLPVLELEEIAELLELTRDEVMIFLPKAMEEIGSRLNRVRKAVQSGDMEAATRHAHTVKSVAGSVGAVAVRETAASLEASAKRSDVAGCVSLIGDLESAVNRLVDEVAAL